MKTYEKWVEKLENDQEDDFSAMVHKWTISDYHTQSIKSEVIIDMLISEFIEEIVAAYLSEEKKIKLDEVILLAKEFPIKVNDENLRNAKVDYLMKVKDDFYFIELKTTNESLDEDQRKRMENAQEKKANGMWGFFVDILESKMNKTGNATGQADSKKYFFTWEKIKRKLALSKPEELKKLDGEIKILYLCMCKTGKSLKKDKGTEENNGMVDYMYLKEMDANGFLLDFLKNSGKEMRWEKTYSILQDVFDIAIELEGNPKN